MRAYRPSVHAERERTWEPPPARLARMSNYARRAQAGLPLFEEPQRPSWRAAICQAPGDTMTDACDRQPPT
jgi:hypothetical protein